LQSEAASLLGGSGVVSVATDATSGSGVYIAAGSTLFKVSILGDVTPVGRVVDTGASGALASLVPSGIVFHTSNRQCSLQSTSQGGEVQTHHRVFAVVVRLSCNRLMFTFLVGPVWPFLYECDRCIFNHARELWLKLERAGVIRPRGPRRSNHRLPPKRRRRATCSGVRADNKG
jgi:hypothetical protein